VDGVPVLAGVSLEVAPRSVMALLGKNGMGKTTTLRTVMGLVRAARGEISLGGRDLRGLPTAARAAAGLWYVPENGGVFSTLTVEENLLVAARMPVRRALEAFPELEPLWRRPAGFLSGGERKLLALARAFVSGAAWFLVDEPSLGLSPQAVERLARALEALAEKGGVLLVEQHIGLAERVAHRFTLIDRGRTVDSGDMRELRRSPHFQASLTVGPVEPEQGKEASGE
jgi:branched-chain amino acid transport system ATP-binding protein